jgi:hypothetical protein
MKRHAEVTNEEAPTISPFSSLFAEVESYLAKPVQEDDEDLRLYEDVKDLGDGILKEMYLKYNTRLPSSARSERMFSTSSHIFTKFRTSMENFRRSRVHEG